jgi:protein arginine kinase
MEFNSLLRQEAEWLKGTGPNSDIVMSSRIRLARNLEKIPFSHWADRRQLEEVLAGAQSAVLALDFFKNGLFLKLRELNNLDRQFLIERHLVSREFISGSNEKAVAISDKEIISLMVNEEDHLRFQVIFSGFNLMDAWRLMDRIESQMGQKLNFAFHSNWGYLTACPTNTGTGLRASVMLHLPALVITKQINRVLHAIAKLSLTVRGFYGEGTEARGNFFQISNQVSLGHSEEEIIDNIERIIKQVIEQEQNARESLANQSREMLQDRIFRAYGTLKSAHIITSNETIDLLSSLRLGLDLGIIKEISRQTINELFILTQPAHLQKLEGRSLTPNQRDIKRAEIIRSKLR